MRPTPAVLWVHFEVGVRGEFGSLSGRCHSSADLNPELEIPVDGILFLVTWLRALSVFKLRVVLGVASRHGNLHSCTVLKDAVLLCLLEYTVTRRDTEFGLSRSSGSIAAQLSDS